MFLAIAIEGQAQSRTTISSATRSTIDVSARWPAAPFSEPRLLEPPGLRPRIVNGLSAAGEFPTVGAILKPLENPESHCTGTLIGCETVLTAAHCFDNEATQEPCDLLTSGQIVVHLQHAGFFAVSSISCHPDESFAVASDLAVLELATPVSGIAPSPINTISKPPPGTEGVIVGYGRTEGDLGFQGRGIKRAGAVTTSTCQLVPDATHTCWDFTEPRGPAGSDASTCNGDSGGPLFVNAIGVGAVLAGVTSGGQNPACDEPTFLFDADVYYDRQWVQTAGGADLANTSCGPLPSVGSPPVAVTAEDAFLPSSSGGALWQLDVPAGRVELRVSLNGQTLTDQDFDLLINRGSAPTVADFDCASTNDGMSSEFCSISNPQPGTWWFLINNPFASEGDYQLVITLFEEPTPCTTLDADGNESIEPLSDGLLILRYLFGFTGSPLIAGAVGEGATRADAGSISNYIAGCGPAVLDVDGDGFAEPLTDGLLFLRYLFGFRGTVLTAGAVDLMNCTRCTAVAIEEHISDQL